MKKTNYAFLAICDTVSIFTCLLLAICMLIKYFFYYNVIALFFIGIALPITLITISIVCDVLLISKTVSFEILEEYNAVTIKKFRHDMRDSVRIIKIYYIFIIVLSITIFTAMLQSKLILGAIIFSVLIVLSVIHFISFNKNKIE
ncbi:MAG: hypothetical protein RR136_00860 [Clostridia bacterium]